MVPQAEDAGALTDALHAAKDLQETVLGRGWRFCFIGGLALQRWGEPRVTVDVDVTLLTGFGDEEPFIRHLVSHYAPRRPDAAAFALRNRVLLLKTRGGVGLDIALGGLPFEEDAVSRATPADFLPDVQLVTCSAEDLVVMKTLADRARDWVDIRTVLIRQAGRLDLAYIRRQLRPLVQIKEQPDILARLDGMFREEGLT